MSVTLDAAGRDPAGFACCAVCGYPYVEPKCPNPGCRANMSAAKLVEIDALTAAHNEAEAERERIRQIRNRPAAKAPPAPVTFIIASADVDTIELRGDTKRKRYASVQEAEKRARSMCVRLGPMVIYAVEGRYSMREIAVCMTDALDRVWTEVNAAPGQSALL